MWRGGAIANIIRNDQTVPRRVRYHENDFAALWMGDLPRAVGPLHEGGRSYFLCPACDAHRVPAQDVEEHDVRCTVESLRGQHLQFNGRACDAWESDPFEGEDVPARNKRFFFYSAISRQLGAVGQRVDLPECVKVQISKLYGQSETGFRS